jgi:hypothetical protein
MRRAVLLGALWATAAGAQSPPTSDSTRLLSVPPPQAPVAERLLAAGRLAAAEAALYAAADARPRAPEPRGALAMYLASRGRFRIAEILLEEAQRFGASAAQVRRALALFAPYRVAVPPGAETTVSLTPTLDARALWQFPIRAGDAAFSALFDPSVRGLRIGRGAAQTLGVQGRAPHTLANIWIGERRLARVDVTVDSLAAPDEIRIGLDALWALHPLVDERAGTLTLGRAPNAARLAGRVEQVPFVLTFPGMLLVPTVGQPPIGLEARAARALLRGTRWQVDAATATLIVER